MITKYDPQCGAWLDLPTVTLLFIVWKGGGLGEA